MNPRIKIQHYVPVFYLRNFSLQVGNENIINCFDKQLEKNFVANIKKIGCEKYFHDISDQSIEKNLSKLESKFNMVYNKLITTMDLNSLRIDERIYFLHFIVIQYLRTKQQR